MPLELSAASAEEPSDPSPSLFCKRGGEPWLQLDVEKAIFCLIYTVVISIFSSTLSLELRSISSSQPRLQKKQLQNLNANICQTQWGTRSGDAGSCCSAARRRLLGILRSWSSYSSSALHHGTCCQGIVTKLLMLILWDSAV